MNRGCVLLAEDEAQIAKLIAFKLGKVGYDVVCVAHGQLALEYLRANPSKVKLIVLDVMMPVMDGWETLKHLKAEVELDKIPVLILSAKGGAQDVANASSLGATRFLKKPFDPTELARVVKEMVGN